MAEVVCKACGQLVEGKPLLVLEGATDAFSQQLSYFHGLDCWNRYKSSGATHKVDTFVPDIIKRRLHG